jgi:hypothetical protein
MSQPFNDTMQPPHCLKTSRMPATPALAVALRPSMPMSATQPAERQFTQKLNEYRAVRREGRNGPPATINPSAPHCYHFKNGSTVTLVMLSVARPNVIAPLGTALSSYFNAKGARCVHVSATSGGQLHTRDSTRGVRPMSRSARPFCSLAFMYLKIIINEDHFLAITAMIPWIVTCTNILQSALRLPIGYAAYHSPAVHLPTCQTVTLHVFNCAAPSRSR